MSNTVMYVSEGGKSGEEVKEEEGGREVSEMERVERRIMEEGIEYKMGCEKFGVL